MSSASSDFFGRTLEERNNVAHRWSHRTERQLLLGHWRRRCPGRSRCASVLQGLPPSVAAASSLRESSAVSAAASGGLATRLNMSSVVYVKDRDVRSRGDRLSQTSRRRTGESASGFLCRMDRLYKQARSDAFVPAGAAADMHCVWWSGPGYSISQHRARGTSMKLSRGRPSARWLGESRPSAHQKISLSGRNRPFLAFQTRIRN